MKKQKTLYLTKAAIIAALYVATTLLSASLNLAFGPLQLRLGEALCILPVFTPAAIPGLFIGCILANLLGGAIPLDVVFGSVATLLGALGTYVLRNRPLLSLIPPVAANTAIVPFLLYYAYGFRDTALPLLFLSIFAGEALSAGLLGYGLRKCLTPFRNHSQ